MIASGEVTRHEVINAANQNSHGAMGLRNANFSDILTFIGGAIVLMGIIIFVSQQWDTMSSFTKILSTLGSAIAAYIVGGLFGQQKKSYVSSQVFYCLACALIPLGIYVLLNEMNVSTSESGMNLIVSSLAFAALLLSYFLNGKQDVFFVFSVIYGTWFYFAVTGHFARNSEFYYSNEYLEYRVLIAGISYLFLGHWFSTTTLKSFSSYLYGFGAIGFLGAALSLGGWTPTQNMFWELSYPLFVFGFMYLSVRLKARSLLLVSSMFLMVYIIKITSEYFSDTLGWPLALVMAGLLLMVVGYGSVRINKKYIAK